MEGIAVISLPKDRRRRRIIKAAAAATAGVAVAGAFFAAQANAQPTKNVKVYTDRSIGCVWVGGGSQGGNGNYIQTGFSAGWRDAGIQAPVGSTVTAKSFKAGCKSVQNGEIPDLVKLVTEGVQPTNLGNLWLDTNAAPSDNIKVFDPSTLPTAQNFVLFSNRSGLIPKVCISWWYDRSYGGPADKHECKTVKALKKTVWWLPSWGSGTNPFVHFTVEPSGSGAGQKDFDPNPHSPNCYRETSSGKVHLATDKACTAN
jgi:hypothetical protein